MKKTPKASNVKAPKKLSLQRTEVRALTTGQLKEAFGGVQHTETETDGN